MKITAVVSGDRDVAARLDRIDPAIHKRLVATIESLTARLEARVRAAAPKRTGRLASQIASSVNDSPDFVRGRVTVRGREGSQDFAKAGALEYGVHDTFTVREHKRRGRGIGMEQIVERYQRTANIVETRFLRGPLAAMRGDVEREIAEAVTESAREFEIA